MKKLKKFIYQKIFLKYSYKIFSFRKLNENLIVMADIRYTEMPDNMKAIYNEIDLDKYNVITFFNTFKDCSFINKIFYKIKFMYYFSVAKYMFVVDYYPLIYPVEPRKETKIIQLWHACGAFKKFGYSTMDLPWGQTRESMEKYPIHNTYTHVIVSSNSVRKYYAEAFNMDIEKVYDVGVPRTDIYFNEDFKNKTIKNFKESYNIKNKKVILYAPTYRGNNLKNSTIADGMDMDTLYNILNRDYIVLLKLHPHGSKDLVIEEKHKDFAINVTNDLTIEEAFIVSDMMISDYSSVIFEYSLLNKPIIMFPYDLEEYDGARGFFLDYEAYCCGSVAFNNHDLSDIILSIDDNFDYAKLDEFKKFFMSACNGNSIKNVIDLVFE